MAGEPLRGAIINGPAHPSDLPPEIGPHEGRELELLLAGEKPLALFSDMASYPFAWGEEKFQPHVEAGRIVKREEILRLDHPVEHVNRFVYYALPGEAWRIDRLSAILRTLYVERRKTTPEIEAEIGRLLGYGEREIAVYVERFFRGLP